MMSSRPASWRSPPNTNRKFLPRLVGFICTVALVLGGPASPASLAEKRGAGSGRMAKPGRFDALGQEIVKLVREKFYDPKAAEAWVATHDHYGAQATTRGDFDQRTRRALEELKTSHTGFYTPSDPAYYGLLAIFREAVGVRSVEYDGIGADFTPDGFVRAVFAGGPAEQSGLRRGDRVLKAGGKDFQPVLSFRGRAGGKVILSVETAEGGPTSEVAVTPRRIDPRVEWKQAQEMGSKLIQRDGNAVAYVPLFSCAGEQYREALQDSLQDELAQAQALILDFRNGWGGCNPDFVSLFDQAPPVLTSIGRDGKERALDSQWRRPLFVLINGGTRSGKEVVSFAVKQHRLGKLIGKRTAGAVSGGTCFLLSDRSLLFLAVSWIRVDGEELEGRGVDPDVEVEDALPYAAGADPQLEKAIALAAKAASG